jgi:multidrug efflux pump
VVGHNQQVLAAGPGAGARNSIGIMRVTGMVIGSFFTLFVVPSIYMLLARTHRAPDLVPAFVAPSATPVTEAGI